MNSALNFLEDEYYVVNVLHSSMLTDLDVIELRIVDRHERSSDFIIATRYCRCCQNYVHMISNNKQLLKCGNISSHSRIASAESCELIV